MKRIFILLTAALFTALYVCTFRAFHLLPDKYKKL